MKREFIIHQRLDLILRVYLTAASVLDIVASFLLAKVLEEVVLKDHLNTTDSQILRFASPLSSNEWIICGPQVSTDSDRWSADACQRWHSAARIYSGFTPIAISHKAEATDAGCTVYCLIKTERRAWSGSKLQKLSAEDKIRCWQAKSKRNNQVTVTCIDTLFK